MKPKLANLLLIGLLAMLVVGVAVVFRLRLSSGDVFPEYSSLRADPLGTRALYEALGALPGFHVDRNFQPLGSLDDKPARTILIVGTAKEDWHRVTREEFDALDAAVKAGGRLVIVFSAHAATALKEESTMAKRGDEKKAKKKAIASERKKEKRDERDDDDEPYFRPVEHMDLHRRWGVELKERWLMESAGGAALSNRAEGEELPDRVAWQSDLYFELEANSPWRVIYRRGSSPVMVERSFGLGSIVLAGDSYFLSNEALQRDRATSLLTWVLGPHSHVTFDESHLGVVQHRGVATLARHYGLASAFFTLVLLALLAVWQQGSSFVPPPEEMNDIALAYHPAAGLEALLRRSIPLAQLTGACVAEWRTSARESDRVRVDAALAALPKDANPVERYNAIVRALRRT